MHLSKEKSYTEIKLNQDLLIRYIVDMVVCKYLNDAIDLELIK